MDTSEADHTVRRNEQGRYLDLSERAITRTGRTVLTNEEFLQLFKRNRLRIALTPQCNLFCGYCSNEGGDYKSRNGRPANLDLVTGLSDMVLENTPLQSIDFSGGEPLLHPDFQQGGYRLVEWAATHPGIHFSIHTNGILLKPETVDRVQGTFSRIGITLNSTNFETWNRMTNPRGCFSEDAQRRKFDSLMGNIEYLGSRNIADRVFLKTVVIRGINDSEQDLADFLETCRKHGFHPKFLQYEAQYPSQKGLEVSRRELFTKLGRIGCEFDPSLLDEEDERCYIPNVNFDFRGIRGLQSMFGCGKEGACTACYDYLCMFVKPTEQGDGLYLKPCSVTETRIDLTPAIRNRDAKQLLGLFKMSREYLMLAPGLGVVGWNKEPEQEVKL